MEKLLKKKRVIIDIRIKRTDSIQNAYSKKIVFSNLTKDIQNQSVS